MIDLETLDTRPSAVVFQVGVLVFQDILGGDTRGNLILEKKIFHLDILEQIMAGRTVDQDTVLWWAEQNLDSSKYVKRKHNKKMRREHVRITAEAVREFYEDHELYLRRLLG